LVLDTPKVHVRILDGGVTFSARLVKPETVEHAVLILVASITDPGGHYSRTTLRKWTTVLEQHLDRLSLDPTLLHL
jgi:hypothetical protein